MKELIKHSMMLLFLFPGAAGVSTRRVSSNGSRDNDNERSPLKHARIYSIFSDPVDDVPDYRVRLRFSAGAF